MPTSPSPPFSTVAGSDTGPVRRIDCRRHLLGDLLLERRQRRGSGPNRRHRDCKSRRRGPTPNLDVHRDGADSRRRFVPVRRQLRQDLHLQRRSNNPPKIVLNVPDVVNNDTPTTAYAGTPQATNLTYTPIFTYILLQTSTAPNSPGQQVPVSVVSPAPAGFFWPLPQAAKDDSIFTDMRRDPNRNPDRQHLPRGRSAGCDHRPVDPDPGVADSDRGQHDGLRAESHVLPLQPVGGVTTMSHVRSRTFRSSRRDAIPHDPDGSVGVAQAATKDRRRSSS